MGADSAQIRIRIGTNWAQNGRRMGAQLPAQWALPAGLARDIARHTSPLHRPGYRVKVTGIIASRREKTGHAGPI